MSTRESGRPFFDQEGAMTAEDRAVRVAVDLPGNMEASGAMREATLLIAGAIRAAENAALRRAVAAIRAQDEDACEGVRGITGECYAQAVLSLSISLMYPEEP